MATRTGRMASCGGNSPVAIALAARCAALTTTATGAAYARRQASGTVMATATTSSGPRGVMSGFGAISVTRRKRNAAASAASSAVQPPGRRAADHRDAGGLSITPECNRGSPAPTSAERASRSPRDRPNGRAAARSRGRWPGPAEFLASKA